MHTCPKCGYAPTTVEPYYKDGILVEGTHSITFHPQGEKLFDVLWARKGKILRTAFLSEVLWGWEDGPDDELNNIRVQIHLLRYALRNFHLTIETIWGTGVRLVYDPKKILGRSSNLTAHGSHERNHVGLLVPLVEELKLGDMLTYQEIASLLTYPPKQVNATSLMWPVRTIRTLLQKRKLLLDNITGFGYEVIKGNRTCQMKHKNKKMSTSTTIPAYRTTGSARESSSFDMY